MDERNCELLLSFQWMKEMLNYSQIYDQWKKRWIIPQFPIGERNVELFLNFVASLLLHTTDRLVVGGETKVQLIKYIKHFCKSHQEDTSLYKIKNIFAYHIKKRQLFSPLEDS